MSPARPHDRTALLSKPNLTVREMTELLAAAVADLPSVRRVEVVDGMELNVALASGQRIEVQTLPVAKRMSKATASDREAIIAEILDRCA